MEKKTNRVAGYFIISIGLLVSVVALAKPPLTSTDNRKVEGMHGLIIARGTVVYSPCYLAPESAVQTVSLGSINPVELSDYGSVTVPVIVKLVLDGCTGSQQTVAHNANVRGSVYSSGQPTVKVTLLGDREPSDARFFQVHGGAKGIALRIEDDRGELIEPGWQSSPKLLNAGRNELLFQAQLWRLAQDLDAGEWFSIVNVGIEYE